jgi:K+:H+ antiporter
MGQVGFQTILVLLAVSVVVVGLFRYLHLPQVLAYLFVGLLVGPSGLSWISSTHSTHQLAEFGLVFLMFTVGLEFSLPRLRAMKFIVFGMGGAQVFISFAAVALVAWLLGVSIEGAIVIGGILSLSSTAIVMKLLTEQLEQSSRHGRHAISVLLFQDIIVVPFLILIPMLAGGTEQTFFVTFGWVLLKSTLVLAGILLFGHWLLRPLFHEVALAHSREFFMLTVLLITLSAAWISDVAGLSLALGAFLAGMMIAETEYRHQVESDILPFRDVLLGLFFITVGMRLNLDSLLALWPWILVCVAVLVVFKTVLVTILGMVFRMNLGVAMRTALVLGNGGEFGFALLLQATNPKLLSGNVLLSNDQTQVILSSIVISMVLATFMVRFNGRIAKALVPSYNKSRIENLGRIRQETSGIQGHVIVCGYGRSGQNLAWMLEQEGLSTVALDLDPIRVRDARDAGKAVVYGDATRRDVLQAAGLDQAVALTVSFDNVSSALKLLEVTRTLRPDMPVIVRTMDDSDIERLVAAGATEVVPESIEGSLMIGSHVLLLLGIPLSHIVSQVREARHNRYRMLRGFFHGEDMEYDASAYPFRLHSITLPEQAYAIGKKLSDINLEEIHVHVTSVRRSGISGPAPEPGTVLQVGDVLVLYGSSDALEQAEKLLLEG